MTVTIEIDIYLARALRGIANYGDFAALNELLAMIEQAERAAIVARATRNSLVSPPLPRLDEPSIQTGD